MSPASALSLVPAPASAGTLYGYLRRSSDEGDPASQEREVRALAARHGFDPDRLVIETDWDVSGGRLDRPGWLRIQNALATGTVEAIFATSVDRLGRDMADYLRVERLAYAMGARIFTNDGERRQDRSVIERIIHPALAQQYREDSQRRARQAKRSIVERVQRHHADAHADCTGLFVVGEHQPHKREPDGTWGAPVARIDYAPGHICGLCTDPQHWPAVKPYGVLPGEDEAAVIAAFEETGSYNAAAMRLNERGIAGRRGRWESTSVRRVVLRRAEHDAALRRLVPRRAHVGSRTLTTHALSGLVLCPSCGEALTNTYRTERSGRAVGMFCKAARVASCQQRPYSVSERYILAPVQAALRSVVGFRPAEPLSIETATNDIDLRLQALMADIASGVVELEDAIPRRDALRAELVSLRERTYDLDGVTFALAATGSPVDWDGAPAAINARLRRLIHHIELGPDMRPVAVVYIDQPTIEVLDSNANGEVFPSNVPDPAAERVDGGWRVPMAPSEQA